MNETVAARLNRLPLRLQVAFAAACAERVIPIFAEQRGDPSPLQLGVEAAWQFACDDITSDRLDEIVAQIQQVTPNMNVESQHFAAMEACVSVVAAVDVIDDASDESAADAARAARDAVDSLSDNRNIERTNSEEAWQNLALELAEAWGAKPITRDMFAALGDDPPGWAALLSEQ